MPEFFQTRMGMRFFEQQVPDLIKVLGRIADRMNADDSTPLHQAIDRELPNFRRVMKERIGQYRSTRTIADGGIVDEIVESIDGLISGAPLAFCGDCGAHQGDPHWDTCMNKDANDAKKNVDALVAARAEAVKSSWSIVRGLLDRVEADKPMTPHERAAVLSIHELVREFFKESTRG